MLTKGEGCAIISQSAGDESTRQSEYPGVAKFGIALEWGSRGRWFESSHSDQKSVSSFWNLPIFLSDWIRTHSNATCRWHVAGRRSRRRPYIYFHSQRNENVNRIRHSDVSLSEYPSGFPVELAGDCRVAMLLAMTSELQTHIIYCRASRRNSGFCGIFSCLSGRENEFRRVSSCCSKTVAETCRNLQNLVVGSFFCLLRTSPGSIMALDLWTEAEPSGIEKMNWRKQHEKAYQSSSGDRHAGLLHPRRRSGCG